MNRGDDDWTDSTSGFSHEAVRLPSLPQRLEIIERLMAEAIADPLVAPYHPRRRRPDHRQPDRAGRPGF